MAKKNGRWWLKEPGTLWGVTAGDDAYGYLVVLRDASVGIFDVLTRTKRTNPDFLRDRKYRWVLTKIGFPQDAFSVGTLPLSDAELWPPPRYERLPQYAILLGQPPIRINERGKYRPATQAEIQNMPEQIRLDAEGLKKFLRDHIHEMHWQPVEKQDGDEVP